MKEKKPPYVPTRLCPHRWCKPLHIAPVPFFLAFFAFELWHNWRFLVVVVLSFVGALVLPKIVHFKRRPRSGPVTVADVIQDLKESPTAIELQMEDALYEGTGWRVLEVRKGWARAAVACDLYLVAVVGTGLSLVVADPVAEAQYAEAYRLDAGTLGGLLFGMLMFGFSLYAHKKATQPRKPKKAWLPAFLRTNV